MGMKKEMPKKYKGWWKERLCSQPSISAAPHTPLTQLDTAGWRTWHLSSQNLLKLECKSLAEASSCTILQKNLYYGAPQPAEGRNCSKEGRNIFPWESQAEQGGSCALRKWWLMLLITQELPEKKSCLPNLGSAPISSPWHVINAHYHQDLAAPARLGSFPTQARALPSSQIPAQQREGAKMPGK